MKLQISLLPQDLIDHRYLPLSIDALFSSYKAAFAVKCILQCSRRTLFCTTFQIGVSKSHEYCSLYMKSPEYDDPAISDYRCREMLNFE